MVQSNCDNQIKRSGAGRITYETGAVLLVAMVTLLVIAFGAIYVTADQILAQHQMLSLELRRLERQNITEEMFESMALDLASTSEGTVWTRSIMNSSASNNQLRAMREPIECPHPFTTTSRCARLWVQQAGTGFLRERVLVEPVPHCNTSYWYAPDFRVGGAGATMPPPVDPDRPSRPDPPPRTLPNG